VQELHDRRLFCAPIIARHGMLLSVLPVLAASVIRADVNRPW